MMLSFFFLIIFFFSFLLTFCLRRFSLYKSFFDYPKERSIHNIVTPKGGGIAISIAWFSGLAYLFSIHKIEKNLFLALLSAIPLAIIGFLDDIYEIKPLVRLTVHFICSSVGLYFIGGLYEINLNFIHIQTPWILSVLAIIGIVWTINLFNFLDGIDGYLSSEVIFLALSVFALFNDEVGLLLAIVLLGFIYWNWQRAKIFIGGISIMLGYNIAVFAIYYHNHQGLPIIGWLILTSVFWFDATVTLVRRIIRKENILQAHKKHGYQRIVLAGFSHQKVVIWSILLNILGFILTLLSVKLPDYSLLFLIIDILVLTVVYIYIERVKPFNSF